MHLRRFWLQQLFCNILIVGYLRSVEHAPIPVVARISRMICAFDALLLSREIHSTLVVGKLPLPVLSQFVTKHLIVLLGFLHHAAFDENSFILATGWLKRRFLSQVGQEKFFPLCKLLMRR